MFDLNELRIKTKIHRDEIDAFRYSLDGKDVVVLPKGENVRELSEFIKSNKAEKEPEEDLIRKPKHYILDGLGIETIDVVKAVLGLDGFRSFCKGNVLKYIIRADKKNHLEDYKKARVYLTWLIESMELDEDGQEDNR